MGTVSNILLKSEFVKNQSYTKPGYKISSIRLISIIPLLCILTYMDR